MAKEYDPAQTTFTKLEGQYRKEYSPEKNEPDWVTEEKAKRAQDPYHASTAVAITIEYLTPAGHQAYAKQYLYRHKTLSLEDFARAIRYIEMRRGIELEKTGFLEELIVTVGSYTKEDPLKYLKTIKSIQRHTRLSHEKWAKKKEANEQQ